MKHIFSFILFILFSTSAFSSSFMPLVRHYSVKDYQADNQNWSVTQAHNGVMYFGNSGGLLSYDGYQWKLTKVAGGQIVRSVFADGQRIYVGSFEEFGYFDTDQYGQLKYHSLSRLLKNCRMRNDEIWKIVKVGKSICFQSFSACFYYDGKTVKAYRDRYYGPLFLFSCFGKMYVQLINSGFSIFNGHSYRIVIQRSQLNNSDVVAVCPFHNKQMLLVTKSGKIYVYNPDNNKLSPFNTQVDGDLAKATVNRALLTKDNLLIIGTISDGLYAIRKDGSLLWHFNRSESLSNNTVLGLCCDANNNIWASLDDGIAFIEYNSPLTLLTPKYNQPPIGMIYSILHQSDKFYLATNQALYTLNTKSNDFKIIPNSNGQNWYINEFDGQVFGGSNTYCINVKNDIVIPISQTTGSTCIKKCTINGKEILLNSTYAGLEVFVKNSSKQWLWSHNITGFSNPVRHFEVDTDGSIWLTHMYKGAYHLWLTDNLRAVRYAKYFGTLNGRDEGHIHVMKIQGDIVLSNEQSAYVYSNIKHALVPFVQLNELLPEPNNILGATEVNSHLFWLITSKGYILVDGYEGQFRIKAYIPFSKFDSSIHNESSVFVDKEGNSYFNLNNGFAHYDLKGRDNSPKLFKMSIEQIECFNNKRESIFLPINKDGEVSFSYREVSFRLLMPHYDLTPYMIHYSIKGSGLNLETDSYDPVMHYGNLDYGTYDFSAVIYNDLNQKIGEVNYHFIINRPFYLSWLAICFYIILLGTAIYYISRWRLHHLMKKEKEAYEIEQSKQKLKMHEQELLIAEQNKKLLESEISLKSKDLASMAMGIIAKNNMLEELRSMIQEQLNKGTTTNKFMKQLLTKISEDIENKEFWELFQQNFDLIHANFFRHLRERYPELTPTDLRFCALLRLNLTTKDIAQINNLTVRGVEAARYRIRKKLNISEEDSLVDFLIDLV